MRGAFVCIVALSAVVFAPSARAESNPFESGATTMAATSDRVQYGSIGEAAFTPGAAVLAATAGVFALVGRRRSDEEAN